MMCEISDPQYALSYLEWHKSLIAANLVAPVFRVVFFDAS